MKKIHVITAMIASIALITVGFLGARLLDREDNIKVSATSIEERLKKCSDLTTARLEYRGIIRYEDGDIQYINKKSFSMIYDAHIKAGIDLSQAEVSLSGKEITVTIPEPKVQDIVIDPDSLEFYDEKLALFNWTKKEDTAKAMKYAKEDAEKKVAQTDLIKQASQQAKTVVTTLLAPITEDDGEYSIKIAEQ
ncbi:MAG: DUF4230 domain-containing protein [Dorea sp.]|jgi:non-ribosomal peptide synthetase component E (peptide arylation enzyme)|nr:DUF4230 domain-containing protein [Dorea sp.]